MITKEQITEILNNHVGYIDRSRTEQAVHEDNFNDVAYEILSKLSQHDVIRRSEQLKAFDDLLDYAWNLAQFNEQYEKLNEIKERFNGL